MSAGLANQPWPGVYQRRRASGEGACALLGRGCLPLPHVPHRHLERSDARRLKGGPSPSGDAGWCTIRTRGQDHQDASVGPGVIPQCWRSGMLGRLHNWRTHPADLHPRRAQDDLRAQRRLMVQGRLDGWLLRASVRSLRTAPLAHSSGEARPERRSREGGPSPRAMAGRVGGHPVGLLCDARRPAQRLVGP
jgi:hypothetical protein